MNAHLHCGTGGGRTSEPRAGRAASGVLVRRLISQPNDFAARWTERAQTSWTMT
jgi:hypothetical protein